MSAITIIMGPKSKSITTPKNNSGKLGKQGLYFSISATTPTVAAITERPRYKYKMHMFVTSLIGSL